MKATLGIAREDRGVFALHLFSLEVGMRKPLPSIANCRMQHVQPFWTPPTEMHLPLEALKELMPMTSRWQSRPRVEKKQVAAEGQEHFIPLGSPSSSPFLLPRQHLTHPAPLQVPGLASCQAIAARGKMSVTVSPSWLIGTGPV